MAPGAWMWCRINMEVFTVCYSWGIAHDYLATSTVKSSCVSRKDSVADLLTSFCRKLAVYGPMIALAASSFLAVVPQVISSHVVSSPLQKRQVAMVLEDQQMGDYNQYVYRLQQAVNELSDRVGVSRPSQSELYKRDQWAHVLEQRLAELEQLRAVQLDRQFQLQSYVVNLEQRLLKMSHSYEFVDAICNVPMVPSRATDATYVAALEEAVARLEREQRVELIHDVVL